MTPLDRANKILDLLISLYWQDMSLEMRNKVLDAEREAMQLVLDLDNDK